VGKVNGTEEEKCSTFMKIGWLMDIQLEYTEVYVGPAKKVKGLMVLLTKGMGAGTGRSVLIQRLTKRL
jgi:hypothetical protein